jgi:hypothetical protein
MELRASNEFYKERVQCKQKIEQRQNNKECEKKQQRNKKR